MKRLLAILLVFVLCLTVTPLSVSAVTPVSSIKLENLDMPMAGATPDTSVTARTSGYTVYSLEWYDVTADRYLNAGDKFIDGNVYRVVIWLEVKDGYEFICTNSYTPSVVAQVNGINASVNKAYEYNAWAMVEVCYTFPATTSKWVSSLNIQLEGITKNGNILYAPEDGPIPFAIQSASEDISVYPQLNIDRYYPDGFRWSDIGSSAIKYNGDHFKGGREYYVHIAIKLNNGGFTDDLKVTINGKSATIKARGQDFAEVGVEVTCFGSIVANDIRPVVILPKDGNCPDYGVTYAYPQCEHIDYASVEGWYDVETGERLTSRDSFVGGKQYRVKICCTAAYPYKFARDANDKMQYAPHITGDDVDSYTFGYDDYRGRELIYLTKTFTAETRDHICSGDWQSDASGHEKYCSICGKALAGGAHWSNGDATCAHGKLCEVCGYEFTEPTENHTPDTSKWIARAEKYHYHSCKICGAHCDISDHIAATTDTPDGAVVCKDCGYIITPAKNHKHNLTKQAKKDATCTIPGNLEHYACDGCSDLFLDKEGKNKVSDPETLIIAPTGHTLSDSWQADGDNHWRTCTVCKAALDETKLMHDLNDDICITCGYTKGGSTEPTQSPEPDEEPESQATEPDLQKKKPVVKTEAEKKEEDEKNSNWLPVLLVALVCFAAAITATVILLKKKKK